MAGESGRPNVWSTLGKLTVALIATGVLTAGLAMPAVLGSGLVGKHYANEFLGTACNLQETKPPQPSYLFARDGKTVIARLFTQDREPIPLSEMPESLRDALVATEDRRFYSHHGVDMRGLIRSAVNTTSGDTQGGSTLTMQYVKQIRYYQAGNNLAKQQAAIAQTLQRKMEDARCALDIEGPRDESKGQILANYLNIAFFGENAYGIEKAAETYFRVPASKLTLAESAVLVGLLRAPSAYDPFMNPDRAKQRRDEVLQNLVNVGKLSQAAADQQKATPIQLAASKPPTVKQGCGNSDSTIANAAFFCDYAVNWLESTGGLTERQLQTGGLRIVTTLDPNIQDSTQTNIAKRIPATSPMTAVLPVVDSSTGDILAMAASKTFGAAKGQTEQPIFSSYTGFAASTYKLFPLLSALSIGVPSTLPITTVGNTGSYKPKNCVTKEPAKNGDETVTYNATETLDSATAKSSNTYFVALTDQVLGCSLTPILDMMRNLGMKGIDQPSDTPNQTWAQIIAGKARAQQLALGSIPTSPLELTGAYAAVANDGVFNAPAPILTIKDSGGSAIAVKRVTGKQVLDPQAARQAVQALEGDTKGVGSAAKKFTGWYDAHPDDDIAGKTGTYASGSKNGAIWFAGMTKKVAATMAIVNFDASGAASTGLPGIKDGKAYGDYAAEVWLKTLQSTISNGYQGFDSPDDVAGGQVPDVDGKALTVARRDLADDGYKMAILGGAQPVSCASDETPGYVGYHGPTVAPKGATITICVSTGAGPDYARPAPIRPAGNNNRNRNRPSGASNRSGGSGNSGGNGRSGGSGNGGGRSSGGRSSGGPPRN